jgi:hypothetical protein
LRSRWHAAAADAAAAAATTAAATDDATHHAVRPLEVRSRHVVKVALHAWRTIATIFVDWRWREAGEGSTGEGSQASHALTRTARLI